MVSGDSDAAVTGQDPLPDVDPVSTPAPSDTESSPEAGSAHAPSGGGPASSPEPEEQAAAMPASEPEPEPAAEATSAPTPTTPTAPPASAGPRPRPRPASIPDGVLTVEDHLERILRGLGPLAPYDQPLVESLGLPLYADHVSSIDLPRFDQALVDGYAVAAGDATSATTDAPTVLPVAGEIRAGVSRPFAISRGTAARISAGSPLPRGADCVVPISHTDRGQSKIAVTVAPDIGQGVRRAGSDVLAGTAAVAAGTVLGAREIGLLASLGAHRVALRPRPRVVVISMGSELREPGDHVSHDSSFDGNSYMLAAAIRAAGAIAFRVGAVGDDPQEFRRVLSEQLVRADLVVTTGGISLGQRDAIRQTLRTLGTVSFNEVAIQPGRVQGFGTVFDDETPIITLPPNGVAAYVGFEVFVLPALRRLMGRTPYRRPMVHAVLAADISSDSGRRQYVPATFEVTHRGAKVTPLPDSDELRLSRLAEANALIVVGEDETALNLGDTVRTLVLDRPF
ncbi:MAG: molybdopterin-binding protein [Aeromicrobium sp.]|uniref:molybdopterin molybdotransferase MoeA n=1 Tax=Aeromicrobium sp. TaxID=1871063 RepID=UPI002633C211|nr:gephyrin-like molybdotransferase Glp [Aeromicrobium sp.]MDF1705923.1 molybdopterin-binding protein [Aeromicrobium sp.]